MTRGDPRAGGVDPIRGAVVSGLELAGSGAQALPQAADLSSELTQECLPYGCSVSARAARRPVCCDLGAEAFGVGRARLVEVEMTPLDVGPGLGQPLDIDRRHRMPPVYTPWGRYNIKS